MLDLDVVQAWQGTVKLGHIVVDLDGEVYFGPGDKAVAEEVARALMALDRLGNTPGATRAVVMR